MTFTTMTLPIARAFNTSFRELIEEHQTALEHVQCAFESGDVEQAKCWLKRAADTWQALLGLANPEPNLTLKALQDASRVATGKEPGGGPSMPLSDEDEARIRRTAEGKD
jgi:hypothetical protein